MRCPIRSTSQSLSLDKIRGNSRVYHSRVKVHAISEIGVCLAEINSFSNRSRPCKFDKYLDTQFVSCKMSHDNFLDKSSLTFLCSRHSHRYFQTTHFSAVKLPSSCSISEHKTDVLYHSYTFILRWWLQLDFHLDLTVLAVRFSRRSPIFVFPNINVSNNKFFLQAHSSKKL